MGAGLLSIFIALIAVGDAPDAPLETHRRRPGALALSVDGRFLYAANRESGTISIIRVETRKVIAEPKVGLGLTGMRERVMALGGTMTVASTEGGLTVEAVVPRGARP